MAYEVIFNTFNVGDASAAHSVASGAVALISGAAVVYFTPAEAAAIYRALIAADAVTAAVSFAMAYEGEVAASEEEYDEYLDLAEAA